MNEAVTSGERLGSPEVMLVLGMLRVEALASVGRWEAALDRLGQLRPLAEQHGPDVFVAHLDYEARLRYFAGDVGAALDACDIVTLTANEQLQGVYASLAIGRSHLLRSRILAAIGAPKAFVETEAARRPFLDTGDRLRGAEQLICQAQVILDTLADHAILFDKARENLELANHTLFGGQRGMTDVRLTCDLHYAVATYYRVGGAADAAMDALQEASRLAEDAGYDDLVAVCAVDELDLGLTRADPLSQPDIERVLSMIERRNRPLELITALRLAGEAYRRLNDKGPALRCLQRAVALYEDIRDTIRNPVLNKDWLRRQRGLLEDVVALHLSAPDGRDEALAIIRQTKSAALRELIRESAVLAATHWPGDDAERASKLWTAIRRLEVWLENSAGVVGNEVQDYKWRVELNTRRRELSQLTERHLATHTSVDARSATAAIWSRLGPKAGETALLEFFITTRGTYIFVSAPDGGSDDVIHLSKPSYRDADAAVSAALDDVSSTLAGEPDGEHSGAMEATLHDFYAALFRTPGISGRSVAQTLEAIGARRLMLIPSGPLAAFPLHAMYEKRDGRRQALIDEFDAVSYAPSLDVLTRNPEGAQRTDATPLAVQDPDRSLRYADSEIQLLRSAVPSLRVLAHEEATQARLFNAFPRTDTLHLACHSSFHKNSPYDSGLLLNDGLMSLAEIYLTADLSSCHLVTLSGCESVRVDPEYGDEFLSITSGFSYAGAASVVGALWPVEDLSTMLLMHKLYSSYASGTTVGAALAEAQAWLREVRAAELAAMFEMPPLVQTLVASAVRRKFRSLDHDARPFSHPAYWAPFTHTGS